MFKKGFFSEMFLYVTIVLSPGVVLAESPSNSDNSNEILFPAGTPIQCDMLLNFTTPCEPLDFIPVFEDDSCPNSELKDEYPMYDEEKGCYKIINESCVNVNPCDAKTQQVAYKQETTECRQYADGTLVCPDSANICVCKDKPEPFIPDECIPCNGPKVHIGNDKDYLILCSQKRTSPSYVVEIDGVKWYADMSNARIPISSRTTDVWHVIYDNKDYSIHERCSQNTQ